MGHVIAVMLWRDDGDASRRKAHRYASQWLSSTCWYARLVEAGAPPEQPFSRAAAANGCLDLDMPDDTVLVVSDADVIGEKVCIEMAVDLARATGSIVLPYSVYRPLTLEGTDDFLVRKRDLALVEDGGLGFGSLGGLFCIRLDAFRTVRGIDGRFVGWGFEDVAFAVACNTLLGPVRRVHGTLTHLWHPTAVDTEASTYAANAALCERYCAADGDRDAMLALIGER